MQQVLSGLGAPASSTLSLSGLHTPRPTILLSKNRLRLAWLNSRDSSRTAGRPGIDNVSASRFAANLDHNLMVLARRLREGLYGPARLRPVFIPKPNSNKERMICIPTVEDRLVQRAIVEYLVSTKKLPIYNASSFGFIRGRGTQAAIKVAVALREQHDWCLKTDIEAFFDRIPRGYLKHRLKNSLGNHSLLPIVSKVIDCEIKPLPFQRVKLERHGIKMGVGVRQGMPLSPILANLVLSRFDKKVEKAGMKMVRYADDILFFFDTREEAEGGHDRIKGLLSSIELTIPEIEDNSKTKLVGPGDNFDFLGREIVRIGDAKVVARIAQKQIKKIVTQLLDDYSLQARLNEGSNFQDTMVDLRNSVSAYLGVYKDAHNSLSLECELRGVSRKIISEIFAELFGLDALSKIPTRGREFLGMGGMDLSTPVNDLEEM